MTTAKKITKTTLKSFVRKNAGKLHVNVTSHFDGMTDCVQQCHGGWEEARPVEGDPENWARSRDLGYHGISLVGQSRDSITAYDEGGYEGFRIYNCVGTFIVAIKKEEPAQAPFKILEGGQP